MMPITMDDSAPPGLISTLTIPNPKFFGLVEGLWTLSPVSPNLEGFIHFGLIGLKVAIFTVLQRGARVFSEVLLFLRFQHVLAFVRGVC